MYQADEKMESSLVSVVNKSRYRDTHSEDTIETLIIFSLLGATTRNKYNLYVRTSHLLSHEICFYSFMNDFKKNLRSPNLPIGMSQMTAMKMSRF